METFIFVLQIFNLIEINLVLNNDWFSWGQSDGFWLAETALTNMYEGCTGCLALRQHNQKEKKSQCFWVYHIRRLLWGILTSLNCDHYRWKVSREQSGLS